MDDKNKIIEKIKKLLKLGNETNFQGESDQALSAAMRLAGQIGMSIEEINYKEENQDNKIDENLVYKPKYRFQVWERQLAGGIAEALGCVLIYRHRSNLACYVLIGTKIDAELFNWLYPYIVKQLNNLCRRDWDRFSLMYPSKFSFERSWYSGASRKVIELARQRFQKEASPEEIQQYALVVSNKRSQCEDYMNKNMNVKEDNRKAKELDAYAAYSGYKAGEKVLMNRPVESNNYNRVEA